MLGEFGGLMAANTEARRLRDEFWAQRVNTDHLSPTVIRGYITHGAAAPGAEHTREHIATCDECAWVFTALTSKNGDDVVLDYVYETREALRHMSAAADRRDAVI